MSADILPFPEPEKGAQGWVCGCGNLYWVLYADGSIYCPDCQHISTVIKVVRTADNSDALHNAP